MANLRKRYEELRPFLTEARAIETALASLEQVARAQVASGSAKTTIADLCETEIGQHGGKIQAGELLGILQEKGHDISQPVLASAIRRDKRFIVPEKGVYQLKAAAPRVTAVTRKKTRTSRSGVTQAAIEYVESLDPNEEFSRIGLAAYLSEKLPDVNTKTHAMRALLHHLVNREYIEVVTEGSAVSPTVYRRKLDEVVVAPKITKIAS
jgi:hypothetical protein